MKTILLHSLFALGGTALFAGSFIGFASLSGQPFHEIAVLNKFVKPPSDEQEAPDASEAAQAGAVQGHGPTHGEHGDQKLLAASVGVLGSFLLPSPFTTSELAELQDRLTATRKELERRVAQTQSRQDELDEWERALEARRAELESLRTALDKRELELAMTADELERDQRAEAERESQSWRELARFFQEGEAEEMALKLAELDPEDAVYILRALDDQRASELVNALPQDKYLAYLEAYRKQQ